MKIRTKIISLLALLFVVLIVLEIAVQQQVLMPSFAELERDDARTSMKRIDYALTTTLDSLELSAADWGNWADVFRFVETPTLQFVTANITPVALKQLQVTSLLIVDLQGNLVLARARDLDSGATLDLDLTAGKALPEDFPWRRDIVEGKPAKGLLRTNLGIMMLAAAPVLDGSGAGRTLGMVIMGRLLTPAQVRSLGAQAQANLSMVSSDSPGGADRLVETDTATQVYRSFDDIYGKPLMSLRVEVPRKITERGQRAVTYASVYLIVASVAALVLLVIVLNRMVLAPLDRVTRHAVAIGEGADLTARLGLPGNDEVAVLAREFDGMVARVAESRRQLVDQSFQAGFAELAKGVLHNLGNAMTPLGVRLAKLADGLRDAPVADVELAMSELAGEAAGTARYADLEEFLRLGSREVGAAVGAARADVTVIQRQTGIVQTALAELMRSTRNEHVVESVRLPDLVQQTLEIVPDACRQRLVVEADDSLRRIGVVQVARTVLRLVLQNLIINAADAVRDAGREKGMLRVAAEIVREADREQLHLRCEDNGVGIAKADLERVFDQGFSTKSRDTNHGIGLHWSANAIAALGGRLWAASEGPGLGASIHLMIPL
jgi:sensor domain CHASE-containing protein/anti-sigma regulatory factor (Ser/Thr protein kinase)